MVATPAEMAQISENIQLHRDAHVVGGELVLRGRLHRHADLRVGEEARRAPAQSSTVPTMIERYSWLTVTPAIRVALALNGVGSV